MAKIFANLYDNHHGKKPNKIDRRKGCKHKHDDKCDKPAAEETSPCKSACTPTEHKQKAKRP